jgi:Lipocalin-like domain
MWPLRTRPDVNGYVIHTGEPQSADPITRLQGIPFFFVTHKQAEAAAAGYLAYSGPFTVDESTGVLHHQPRVPLLPNWLNLTQLRHSMLNGDHLTLSAITEAPDGAETISTLVWKRAPKHHT